MSLSFPIPDETLGADAWGAPSTSQPASSSTSSAAVGPEPTVESALVKERVIKDILTLRDGLRGILVRVHEVGKETDKLAKDNEMLAVYIDNLTRNSVVAAGQKR